MSLEKLETPPITKSLSVDKDVKGIGAVIPNVEINFSQADLILSPVSKENTKISATQEIEAKRVIPYVTAHVSNHGIPAILEMLEARKLEGLLSDSTVTHLYTLITEEQATAGLQDALDTVDEEISAVEKDLAALEGLQVSMKQMDNIFEKGEQNKRVVSIVEEILEELGQDELTQDDSTGEDNFIDVLSEITSMSSEELHKMYTTGIFVQSIADCEFSLRAGVSASYVIEANKRHRTHGRGFSRPLPAANRHVSDDMQMLGDIGIGDDRAYDGVFIKNAYRKTPVIKELSGIDMVAYYCALVSKEFLLSSGLGRLAGTPLGQSFGSDGGGSMLLNKTFGTANLSRLISEATYNGSLSDYGLVRSDGRINKVGEGSGMHPVMLLDAEVPAHWKTTAAKQEWLDTIKSDPLHNKVHLFDTAINETADKFENAQELIAQLLQRDTADRGLLTPRGLFTRIIKDFTKLLTGITVEPNGNVRAKSLSELALLSLSARGSNNQEKYQILQLKRRLHIFACRLANMRRNPPPDDDTVPIQDDSGEPILRLTSRDGTKRFTKILTGLGQDRRDTASAVMILGDDERPNPSYWYGRSGKGLIAAVTDEPGEDSEGLMPSIVQIFEDLQQEAQELAKTQDMTKTYLREGGTTRFSGFDGAITIAFILECFTVLTDIFTDCGIEIAPATQSAIKLSEKPMFQGNLDAIKKAIITGFLDTSHKLWYKGGDNSRLNRTRKFLVAFVAASESSSTDSLFSESGGSQAVSGVAESTNLSYTGVVTPTEMIDILHTLAKEDDAPVRLFAIAKALVDNLRESTLSISQKASALRDTVGVGGVDLPDDILVLKSLKETKAGSQFITNLSTSQLNLAKHRVEILKNASEDGYLIDKTQSSLYAAMRMFWEVKKDEFINGVILFVGLPALSVANELLLTGLNAEETAIQVSIDKKSEILASVDYEPVVRSIPLKYAMNAQSIAEAMEDENPPTTFNDLVLSINYDVLGEEDPLPAEDILALSTDPTQTREQLQLIVESFLLKEIYQRITHLGLTDATIQYETLSGRDPLIKDLMQNLMVHLGISEAAVDTFFRSAEDELKLPNKQRRDRLLLPQSIEVSGTLGWSNPALNSEELMTMYSVLSTKPFFINKVNSLVLSRSIFDNVFAFFVDLDEFSIDKESTTQGLPLLTHENKIFSVEEAQNFMNSIKSPNRFSMDTLYLSVDLEPIT